MSNFKRWSKSRSKHIKPSRPNSNPSFFVDAFKRRLGRTPNEYITEKLRSGSQLDDIKYLFNIMAAEISTRNNCKFFDFDYFCKNDIIINDTGRKEWNPQSARPKNAGKPWTKEEEQLLVKMYNSSASKNELCATFKRTEDGLAAKLVRLGVIRDREVFKARK